MSLTTTASRRRKTDPFVYVPFGNALLDMDRKFHLLAEQLWHCLRIPWLAIPMVWCAVKPHNATSHVGTSCSRHDNRDDRTAELTDDWESPEVCFGFLSNKFRFFSDPIFWKRFRKSDEKKVRGGFFNDHQLSKSSNSR